MSKTTKAFERATRNILAACEEAVAESAREIRDEARKDVPVDEGTLRDNITADINGLRAKVGVFDPDAYYAGYVEFGTSEMRAQPFLGPSAEKERTRLEKRIRKHVERAV